MKIPKPDGGIRLLGIPTVLDRLIQQAIAQELNRIYDHTFSENSYGFRPNKSAVDFVTRRKFLRFSFYFTKGGASIRIHDKSYRKFKDKIRNLTNRNTGISMEYRINKLNQLTVGWINYFGIAKANAKIKALDEWIRRRIRACIWKQWKNVKTRGRNLIKLGLPTYKAWEYANTRKGYWKISKSPILNITLKNKYIENLGYKSISKRYQLVHNS